MCEYICYGSIREAESVENEKLMKEREREKGGGADIYYNELVNAIAETAK